MTDTEENKNSAKTPRISAYIITRDEEQNIGRALKSVQWMDEYIVLDSGSEDDTVEIARDLGAIVSVQTFKDFISQKNKAMELCSGQWLFNPDADEEVTPELRASVEKILNGDTSDDIPSLFKVNRKNQYLGRWIKHCGWYPEYRIRLSRRDCAQWKGEILHEKLVGDGTVGVLSGELLHRPYKSLGDHLNKMNRYSELWAHRESERGRKSGVLNCIVRPWGKFVKMYILKAGFLDAGPGLIASMMGAVYSFLKYARLYELTRNGK